MFKLYSWLMALCLSASSALLFAQSIGNFDYPYIENYGIAVEKELGMPYTGEGTNLIPPGTDLYEGDDVNTIHYGQIPPNSSSKPVIVFVHGYASNASVFYEARDNMYRDVYSDGYRTAFVSLTPNRHMWTNGFMLANAIDQIKVRYGVNQVVLVGWSKGGVDCDAALNHFGSHNDVSQAFTLSSPHNGTAIAELANSFLLSFVNIIFMQDNDATRSLTRGYMSYFRSVTDNDPHNTTPFTTLGGWGSGPLARVSIPQAFLHLNGGSKASGGNDGVVPYQSSVRPNSRELFSGQRKEYYWWGGWYYTGPSQTDLDHFEVTRGGLVWPYIKAVLNGNTTYRLQETGVSNPNQSVRSQLQILSSNKGQQRFFVSKNSEKVQIILGQQNMDEEISILDNKGQKLEFNPISEEKSAAGIRELQLEYHFPESGWYTIESEKPFVAIVMDEAGVQAQLNTNLSAEKFCYENGEQIDLEVLLEDAEGNRLEAKDQKVSLVLKKQMNLKFEAAEDAPKVYQFNKKGDRFGLSLREGLDAGIYELIVQIDADDYQRTITHSIAVTAKSSTSKEEMSLINAKINQIEAYPNPFTTQLNIQLENKEGLDQLKIYDQLGRLVETLVLDPEQESQLIQWNVADSRLNNGMYILQLGEGSSQVSKTVILNR
jgi:pimeloyl-ACP methyl ester carboxylesterase